MRLNIGLIIVFITIGCVNKRSYTSLEDINVVRTSIDSTYNYKGKLYSGNIIQFDEKGNKVQSFSTEKGKINGPCFTFYPDGALKISANYLNGILEGENLKYYPNGIVAEEIYYKNGLIDGKRKAFWDNGLLKEENEFKKGVLVGTSKFYFSNGKMRKQIGFDNKGERDGVWLDYYPNGQLKEKALYLNGKIKASEIRYDNRGNQTK